MGLLWKSGVYLARWGCDQSNVRLSHTFSDTLRIWRKNMRNVASKMSFHRDFAYGDQPFSQSGHILGPTKPRDTCNPRGTWKKQGLFQQALLWIPHHLAKAPWFTENLLLISFALSNASWCTAETNKNGRLGKINDFPSVSNGIYTRENRWPPIFGDLFEPCPATLSLVIVADHVELPAKHVVHTVHTLWTEKNIAIGKIIKCFIGKSSDLMVM